MNRTMLRLIKVAKKRKAEKKQSLLMKTVGVPFAGYLSGSVGNVATNSAIVKAFVPAIEYGGIENAEANRLLRKYLKKKGIKNTLITGARKTWPKSADHFMSHYVGLGSVEALAKAMGTNVDDVAKAATDPMMKDFYENASSALKKGYKSAIKHSGSIATALHEGGHAANWKHLNNGAGLALGALRVGLPSLGALGAIAASATAEDGVGNAPLIAGLSAVPLVAEEALASARALKFIAKEKGVTKALKSSLPLGVALGSYAAYGILPYLGFKYTPSIIKGFQKYFSPEAPGGRNAKTKSRSRTTKNRK